VSSRIVTLPIVLTLAAASFSLGCGATDDATRPSSLRGAPAEQSTPTTVNPIVAYLRGAELQCEDDSQRANIRRALDDLATLPIAELRARRYADYQGAPGAWDLPRVLRSHFVPDDQRNAGVIDAGEAFWVAADAEEVRALARELGLALDDPGRGSSASTP
jgi:hypothetical protein